MVFRPKLMPIIATLCIFWAPFAEARLEIDKAHHFVAAGMISSFTYQTLQAARIGRFEAAVASVLAANALGLVWEGAHPNPDIRDIKANLAGSFTLLAVTYSF